MRNDSCETECHLHIHFHANQSHFHFNGVARTRFENEAKGNYWRLISESFVDLVRFARTLHDAILYYFFVSD